MGRIFLGTPEGVTLGTGWDLLCLTCEALAVYMGVQLCPVLVARNCCFESIVVIVNPLARVLKFLLCSQNCEHVGYHFRYLVWEFLMHDCNIHQIKSTVSMK